jgi:hypothetical protein
MHSSSGDPFQRLSFAAAEETLANIVKAVLGHAPDFAAARKEQPDPGTFLWSWGEGPGLRTFKNFAFRDADHATVLLAIMRRDDALGEIEMLRGDGKPITLLPPLSELKEITSPGLVTFDD